MTQFPLNKMKSISVFILLINFLCENLFAQQCGYDQYYLFVLDVHSANSTVKVPDLKMYLVDEQEKPVLAGVSYFEDNEWKYRSDTLFFWEHNLLKQGAGNRPLFRQKYYNIGDYYVVAFRLDKSELEDPLTYPIYKVKIQSQLTHLQDQTTIVHLPLQRAVRICGNGITEDFPLVKPVQTLDGKIFEPINIVLDQHNESIMFNQPKDELHYAVRFDYQTLSTPYEGINEYLLNGAKIYSTQTGKLQQEIYIPRISKSTSKENKNIVKFIDFYNRGITEAKDFSVQIESWRDLEIKGYRQKLNYYIFNTFTKQYDLDTVLSNYNDVFYYEPSKSMRRYDYEVTANSRIAYTYQLENKTWVLIDKSETMFTPPTPKISFPSTKCIIQNENSHLLPLKVLPETHTKLMVKDTFWLYNTCDDTLYITQVQSATRDFFSINQTLLPKQRTPLIFNGYPSNDNYDFTTNHFNCSLTLTDGSVLGLDITIPTVSNNSTVYYRADSSITYAVANTLKGRFSTAVFTFPSGQIRAKGTIQDNDTSLKVGDWLYFREGTLSSDQEVYSKAVSISAFDGTQTYEHNQFKVKVLENGNWKEPVTDAFKNELRFYISPKTDSILAYTDTTAYCFGLSYSKVPVQIKKQIFLLMPGERRLKIGNYEMPFNVVSNQYAIILNYSRFKSANRTTYQLTDSIISILQKQYPDITTVWISKNQRGINLERLENETREKLLQQLTGDSSISFVSQLFYTNRNPQRLSYCDNRVYADIDIEDPDKFRRTALKLGFSDIEIDMGNNRFWLTYPGKMIDEGFFEAFDKLTREKLVFGAYLNSYFEPELDINKTD